MFCERQFALIHIEGLWAENRLTVEGRQLHERVDSGDAESRDGIRLLRAVPLSSSRLGLTGRADVVELHDDGAIVPVEYKHGQPKRDNCDQVQLCAQAICLEESFGRPVTTGFLYYARTRRRQEVRFDPKLRAATAAAAMRGRELMIARSTPLAHLEKKCEQCSLLDLCLPQALGAKSARRYLEAAMEAAFADNGG